MKIVATSFLLAFVSSFAGVASAREPARLDSTSLESFDASFKKLVRPLNAREKRALALGLFGALLKHECLSTAAVIHLTFSPVGPRDAPLVNSCRQHLNEMSYDDIIKAGEPPEGDKA